MSRGVSHPGQQGPIQRIQRAHEESRARSRIVVVSGPPGSGKSHLIRSACRSWGKGALRVTYRAQPGGNPYLPFLEALGATWQGDRLVLSSGRLREIHWVDLGFKTMQILGKLGLPVIGLAGIGGSIVWDLYKSSVTRKKSAGARSEERSKLERALAGVLDEKTISALAVFRMEEATPGVWEWLQALVTQDRPRGLLVLGEWRGAEGTVLESPGIEVVKIEAARQETAVTPHESAAREEMPAEERRALAAAAFLGTRWGEVPKTLLLSPVLLSALPGSSPEGLLASLQKAGIAIDEEGGVVELSRTRSRRFLESAGPDPSLIAGILEAVACLAPDLGPDWFPRAVEIVQGEGRPDLAARAWLGRAARGIESGAAGLPDVEADLAGARAAIERAGDAARPLAGAVEILATEVLLLSGETSRARAHLDETLAGFPDPADAALARAGFGKIACLADDWAAGTEEINRALAELRALGRAADEGCLRWQFGSLLSSAGRAAEALQVLEANLGPDLSSSLSTEILAATRIERALARMRAAHRGVEDADQELRRVVLSAGFPALSPALRFQALAALGHSAGLLGRFEEGRSELARALELARSFPELEPLAASALNSCARLEIEAGNPEAAREKATKALELAREFGDAYSVGAALTYLGLAHHERWEFDDAIRCYEENVEHNLAGPRRSPRHALGKLALIFEMECLAGRLERAGRILSEIETLEDELDPAGRERARADRLLLGAFHAMRMGDLPGAKDFFDQARALSNDAVERPAPWLNRGVAEYYRLRGKTPVARQYIEKALATNRGLYEEALNRSELARILAAEGKAKEARMERDRAAGLAARLGNERMRAWIAALPMGPE
ncbi:MAG: tetratricopeptide repeat protein [Planctomycetes bacterium]|nr:tetratricopeptide repeat protein [Planctomycetota bacterium]